MSSFQLIRRDNELDINIALDLGPRLVVIGDEMLCLPEIFYLAMSIHDPLKWLEDQGFVDFLRNHLNDERWVAAYKNGNENDEVLAWLNDFVKWLASMPRRPKFGVE